jgi:branched-subunit amino acid aminotransferase/4-amino-4-deoxychorismate lyase
MKVDVYWNLHKQTFSIRSREKENYGRVIRHADHVHIKNPTTVVSKAGRERVLREKKKNVHAVIRGVLIGTDPHRRSFDTCVQQTTGAHVWHYNPYEHDQFVCRELVYTFSYFFTRAAEKNVADHEWTDAILNTSLEGRPIVKGLMK